jgi:hypothetical protein
MYEIRQLGLDLESVYTQITGHVPNIKKQDSESEPGAADKTHIREK